MSAASVVPDTTTTPRPAPVFDFTENGIQASNLDDSFFALLNYYGQSTGKKAKAVHTELYRAFPDSGNGGRPRHLAPMGKKAEAEETPEYHAWRMNYWLMTLRPLLTDAAFLLSLQKTTLHMKYMRFKTEDRDADIRNLVANVAYWDKHFGVPAGSQMTFS